MTELEERSAKADDESLLRAVIDTVVDGLIIIDQAGRVEVFNPACEKLFGYTGAEVLGRNVNMLMPAPYAGEHDAYLAAYRDTGNARIIGIGREVSGRRKDGSVFPMELSVGETQRDGVPIFVGIVRDISERHAAQAKLHEVRSELEHVARHTAMGEMASGLAHELNQPLTAIGNYLTACRRLIETGTPEATDKALGYMERSAEQAGRAGKIIRRLRQFIERGDTDRTAEDLNDTIREAKALVLVGETATAVTTREDFADDLPPVYIDRIQIQQVVVNLMRNAIDAMDGAAHASLLLATAMGGPDRVRVTVTDNGPGLAPDVAETLFQPFKTTKAKGMGLGLSICQSIIQAHDGRITASTGEDGGARFSFTLPVAEGD
jgi:two-component system sensor kinase FixL